MTNEDSSQPGHSTNGETEPVQEGTTSDDSPDADASVVTPTPDSHDVSAASVPCDSAPDDGAPGDGAPRVVESEPALLESPARAMSEGDESADEAPAPGETVPPGVGLPDAGPPDTRLPNTPAPTERTLLKDEQDGTGDAAGITEELADKPDSEDQPTALRWDYRAGTHQAAVELKRIETEVRQLLDDCDTKRKRKLGGTHRWQELEEDVMGWRYRGRIDEERLDRLQGLIARRHHFFKQLRFLSSTRATWNS